LGKIWRDNMCDVQNTDKEKHSHSHNHTQTKAVVNRLSRAIGHLESVKRMVEDGRDCTEVLIQLSAVKSAINNTGKLILKDHIEHCIVHAMNLKILREILKIIYVFNISRFK